MTAPSTRLQHLRVAFAALRQASQSDPRAAPELLGARTEMAAALHAAEAARYGHTFGLEWVTVKHAAAELGITEDAVQALCRRRGKAIGVRDGRTWLVRASWLAERLARRDCRVVSG